MFQRSLLLLVAVAALDLALLAQSEIPPISGAPPPRFPGGVSTAIFHTVLNPANEVPTIGGVTATAPVTIRIHRALGQGAYAVDFVADYRFPGPVTITGFHIHQGAAGTNGPVVLDSGISAASPQVSQTGWGSIEIQISGAATHDLAALLTDIAANPGSYYANIHTLDYPDGAMRSQLAAARQAVVMGLLTPAAEVPAVTGLAASAAAAAVATITRDSSGALSSAELLFDLNYNFPAPVTFTGFEIHAGSSGSNGPVVFDSGLTSTSAGAGGSLRLRTEMDVRQPAVAAALEALFADPSGYYFNLHTADNPDGALRAPLARSSHTDIQVGLGFFRQFDNATGIADGDIVFDVLRSPTGDIQAAMVTFDVDYNQLSPGTQFTALSLDSIAAPFSVSSPLFTATGQGSIYSLVTLSTPQQFADLGYILETLDASVVLQPASGPGPMLGQLHPGSNIFGKLAIQSIQSAAGDPNAKPAAPGALISLYGTFPVNPADVTGLFPQPWPTSLNGAWVTVAGRRIPIAYLATGQINAQLPADIPTGNQPVQFWIKALVSGGPDYRSDPFTLAISPQAPAIFVSSTGPIITHADGTLVNAAQPAAAGDLVTVYVTGIAPLANGSLPAVTATIGTAAANVESAAAAPWFPGLELVNVRIPSGLTSFQSTLQLNVAGTLSNRVPVWVQ